MVKYLGDGRETIYGVPMRDMTDDEWAALPEERRDFALATGRFEVDADDAGDDASGEVVDDTQPVVEPDWDTQED
jgi:hypothetical protein